MLRRRNIVEGAIPPSTDSIWLDEDVGNILNIQSVIG